MLLGATRGSASVRERTSSATFYAQAWLLVHYLKLADGGRYAAQLTVFMARIAQGMPANRAAVEAFGDLTSLSQRLEAYARSDRCFDARFPGVADGPPPTRHRAGPVVGGPPGHARADAADERRHRRGTARCRTGAGVGQKATERETVERLIAATQGKRPN